MCLKDASVCDYFERMACEQFSCALEKTAQPSLTTSQEHEIGLSEQSDILCPKTDLRDDLGQPSHFTDGETFAQRASAWGPDLHPRVFLLGEAFVIDLLIAHWCPVASEPARWGGDGL